MKYTIDYVDKNDDLCHVWVQASGKEEAKRVAKREYWDIARIIQVIPMKEKR